MSDTDQETLYTYKADDPHTAIPDWIATCRRISIGARHMAHLLILLGKGGDYPTQTELASVMGVERRSIARWADELRDAGHLSTRKHGRRTLLQLHRSTGICDLRITYRGRICDPQISDHDHGLRDHRSRDHISRNRVRPPKTLLEAVEGLLGDEPICDPLHGGGGGDDSQVRDSPTPTAADLKTCKPSIADLRTETGRWMVKEGFSLTAAIELQGLDLASAQADYGRRRQMGQQHGAIVIAWRVEAPAGAGQVASAGPWSAEEFAAFRSAMGYAEEDGHETTT